MPRIPLRLLPLPGTERFSQPVIAADRVRYVGATHLAEPSPQRTPVLYQAGSSTRGREFAATHAECVFVFGADKRITRDIVADIRGRAAAHGRDPRDILIFYNRAAVVGRTRREASPVR